ncbi:MAG: hypothetical protein U1E58_07980 [Tabrizicola sp.]
MTELEQSAFFADLEAELAALDDAASSKDLWLLEELEAIGNAVPCAETQLGFVADGQACDVRNPLEIKVTSGQAATLRQCMQRHMVLSLSPTPARLSSRMTEARPEHVGDHSSIAETGPSGGSRLTALAEDHAGSQLRRT